MRLRNFFEDGRIVKGVNTTVDVGTNEIPKQARKFGNSVDKDGKPPTLSSKVKGKSTNVLFNLGLSESVSKDELKKQLAMGVKVEMEHTDDPKLALKIAMDHIKEDPLYYDHLKFVELGEALGEIASATEIYVDMDGVLADFFGDWAKLMGKNDWRDIGKENIPDALEKIKQTENFWLELPLTSNAKQLLGLIKEVKGEYHILSSPLPGDPNSEPHKREWIEKHLNFFPPTKVIITHDKAKYATQEDGTPNILIDDYGVNIQKWEAAGGFGFKHKDHKFERTAKNIKQHMQEPVEENFADGKKKGKSRPGRVKRSGASCNGSVTSLRKRAKAASGEKARMYHWCANMKSGRKKK